MIDADAACGFGRDIGAVTRWVHHGVFAVLRSAERRTANSAAIEGIVSSGRRRRAFGSYFAGQRGRPIYPRFAAFRTRSSGEVDGAKSAQVRDFRWNSGGGREWEAVMRSFTFGMTSGIPE